MVSTLHADSVHGVIEAIALNLQMNKSGLDVSVARKFFESSVDIVVQIVLDKATNTRYIQEILPTKELESSLWKSIKTNENLVSVSIALFQMNVRTF